MKWSKEDSSQLEPTVDTPSPLKHHLLPGSNFGNRYKVVHILGEGGMGTVYRAYDKELNREVALKLIKPSATDEVIVMERFKREILLASKITHKNVLRIHDLGDVDGTKYVSMNYVKGENLSATLKRQGALPIDRAVDLVQQFCHGLKAAHDEGVLHRDLKPQNILIDERDHLYITDFGLARSIDLKTEKSLTRTGAMMGTPMYMSPEQIKAEEPDKRSDLYTFGLILYEILTGEFPFEMTKGYESLFKRVREKPKDPSHVRSEIPDYLAEIAMKCMEPQMEWRYQDAGEILEDLEARSVRHVGKSLKRRLPWRKPALAAALFIIVFLGVWWFFHREPAQSPVIARTVLTALPMENATGDKSLEWMSTGIPDMIVGILRENGNVQVVSRSRLAQIQRGLQFPEQKMTAQALARHVAELGGANTILTGKFTKENGVLSVTGLLMDFKVDPVAPSQIDARGNIERIVATLSRQIQQLSGFAARVDRDPSGSVKKLLSTSQAALSSYYEGLSLLDQVDQVFSRFPWLPAPRSLTIPEKATELLKKAVQQDPSFALAHAKLAEVYYGMGQSEQAQRSLQNAMKASDALPQYEFLQLQLLQAKLKNNSEKTIQAYRQLQSAYPNSPEAYADLGSFFYDQEDWKQALENYQKAWELDPKSVYVLMDLGVTEWKNANPQNALKYLTDAQTLSLQFESDQERSELLIALGLVYWSLQYHESALEHYQKALQIKSRIGDRKQVATILNNMAIVYKEMGRYEDSRRSYQEALAIDQQLGYKKGIAWILNNLGNLAEKFGYFDEALDYHTRGLDVARTVKSRFDIANGLGNIGWIYYLRGRYTDAATYYQLGLQEIGDTDRMLKARILFYKGILLTDVAKYADALDSFSPALKIWRDSQDAVGLAFTLIHSAGTYNLLGLFDEGNKRIEEAQKVANGINDKEASTDLLMRRCEMLRLRQELNSIEPLITQTQQVAEESKVVRAMLVARLEVAALYNQLHEPDRSLPLLQKTLKETERMGLKPLTVRAKAEIGKAYELQHKPMEALREIRSAIDLAGQLGLQETLLQSHFVAARIYQSQNKPDSALKHYQQALDVVDEIRKDAGNNAASFTQRKDVQELLHKAAATFKAAGQEKQFASYAQWMLQ